MPEHDSKIRDYIANQKLCQAAAFDNDLHHAARRMLMVLVGYADKNGECFPSVVKIAEKMGYTEGAVRKQISILVEKGYISKENRFYISGGQTSNLYTLNHEKAREYVDSHFSKIDLSDLDL